MFLEKFIKKAFVSFYENNEKYTLLIEIIKNNKLIESEKKELNSKKELNKLIRDLKEDYPQNYISTILQTINQGVIPSCNKKSFLKNEIDIENINFICIKNRYSFFVSMYDLVKLKKEFKWDMDFIFSIFAPIDFYAKNKNNYMYVLILNTQIIIIAYKENIPIYADISFFEKEEILETNDNEDMELLEDIDIENEISEDIEDEADNISFEKSNGNLETTDMEFKITNILKESIKDYYENYSDDFLEKIVLLDTIEIGDTIKELIEDELLMESEIIQFDLLKTLNELAKGEINV